MNAFRRIPWRSIAFVLVVELLGVAAVWFWRRSEAGTEPNHFATATSPDQGFSAYAEYCDEGALGESTWIVVRAVSGRRVTVLACREQRTRIELEWISNDDLAVFGAPIWAPTGGGNSTRGWSKTSVELDGHRIGISYR